MNHLSSIGRVVTDHSLDLQARIEALQQLVDTGITSEILAAISRQIDEELAGNDSRFVIYLIGAVRSIFDRGAIDVLLGLLNRPIDISFRSQSLIGLRELYHFSVRQLLIRRSLSAAAHPAVIQLLGTVDENFVVHGLNLTNDDRQRIEQAILAVAENKSEILVLRDEARQCYAVCHSLGSLIQGDKP